MLNFQMDLNKLKNIYITGVRVMLKSTYLIKKTLKIKR